MSQIQSLEDIKKEKVWNELNAVLKNHGLALFPKVVMSLKGFTFEIELVSTNPNAAGRRIDG